MSTVSSANVTDVNLVLKERTHMRLCLNMLIFTHNLGNWLIERMYDSHSDLIVCVCLLFSLCRIRLTFCLNFDYNYVVFKIA